MSFKYPHTITLEHLTKSNNSQVYGSAITESWFVQPLDMEDALIADGGFSLSMKGYAPITSVVEEGDRVTYSNKKYVVQTVHSYNVGGTAHYKIVMKLLKDGS